MSLIVYTAIIGRAGDQLRPPAFTPKGVRFICFTDEEVRRPGVWEILPPAVLASTPRRTARYYKTMAHVVLPEHETSVWMDACLQLTCDPRKVVLDGLAKYGVATFRHPRRSCIYQEYEACKRLRKDDPKVMLAQIDYYRFLGYPVKRGLAETACVVRRNEPKVNNLNEAWWGQIRERSCRDQLSFDFVAWRTKMKYGVLRGSRDRSPYFKYHPHRTKR